MKVTHFMLGNAGHDPDSPITALTPDPNYDPTPDVNEYRLPYDQVTGLLAVSTPVDDPYFATIWPCSVPKGVATGVVSSVYLMAQFVYINQQPFDVPWVPTPDYTTYTEYYESLGMVIGKYFIYSMGYFPISVKVDNESWVLQCGIQY